MKTILSIQLISSLFIGINLFSQNNDSENLADNVKSLNNLQAISNTEENFENFFDINIHFKRRIKLLKEVNLWVSPEGSSEKSGIIIPEGEIVNSYKYFPKDAVWAVKFNDHWGFIPVTAAVPADVCENSSTNMACDEAPVMLTDLKINYPTEALINCIRGQVIVEVLVGKTGAVLQTEVVESIRGLDDAAIDAINNLKFKPGKYQGKPVNAWLNIPVKFEIEN
jgi:TonB family protein